MCQFCEVQLAINNAQTIPQQALDCGPGLSGLSQVYRNNLQGMRTLKYILCDLC